MKFRAWINEDEYSRMVDSPTSIITIFEKIYHRGQNKDYILMEYTELNDIDNKEIYENDIIEFNNKKGVVYYNKEEFMYKVKTEEEDIPLKDLKNKKIKVIGDIFRKGDM